MAKLMAKHSNNLLRLGLLNQSIVDDNVLLPWQTIEVGIAVGTALAAVNDMELGEREVESLSQVLDTGLEFAGLKRRELVEQRQNRNGVDSNGEDLEEDTEEPEVVVEGGVKLLNNLKNGSDNRSTQNNSEHLPLEHIRNPELDRLLVETELLLKHKRVVVRDGQREDSAYNVETEEEYQCLTNFALEPTGEIPSQHQTAEAPDLGEDIAVDESKVLDLTVKTRDEAELGLCATVCL